VTGADFGGVDIDLLADYIGGVLAGTPEESAVAARIAADPGWQAAYVSLEEGMSLVSAELGRLAPEPMPAELADRLDTMLIAAGRPVGEADAIADADSTAPDLAQLPVAHLHLVRGEGAGGDGAQGVRETQPAPRRGRRLRWAAPIAVAAGLIAFVGFGLDYLAGRDTHSASTDSAGSGTAVRGDAPKFATSGAQTTLASGINYTHDTLSIAPVQPMSGTLTSPDTPGRKTAPEMAAGVESALQRLTAPDAIADCLAAIEEANGGGALSTESIDYARFAGAPAVIVRFTSSNGHWAWASGADCGTTASGAATLDKVPVG
jgi:hypothetical protein